MIDRVDSWLIPTAGLLDGTPWEEDWEVESLEVVTTIAPVDPVLEASKELERCPTPPVSVAAASTGSREAFSLAKM